jgi:hypothetical protein
MDPRAIQNFFNHSTDGIVAGEDHSLVVKDTVAVTEIDLKERVIRKTWKLMGLVLNNTYELDGHETAFIKDKSMALEGYNITSFEVYIANRGMKIRVSWSDDFNEARVIQSEIAAFLKKSAIGCPADVNATASGAQKA